MSNNNNNDDDNKKEEMINKFFFKKKNKILINNNKDINQLYKLNLEQAINDNKYFFSSKYLITVKKCQLLFCIVTINNEIDIEFENGKLLSTDKDILKDKELEENLTKLVENETETIRKKLNLALSINENILSLGYCMDIELIKNVALFDENQMKSFNIFLPSQIKACNKNDKIYEPAYPQFPYHHIDENYFYFYYCKWLYSLEHTSTDSLVASSFDPGTIPSSYKSIFTDIQFIKTNSLYQFLFTHFFRDDLKFTIISLGEENEFYQIITNMMRSPSNLSSEDISDLDNFFKYDKHHLEYIPSDVPNKYNLGQISKLLFMNNNNMSQKDIILPRFKDPVVNDVLNLALIYCNKEMSYTVIPKFNLNYHEADLLIELLKRCDRRYYEFIKRGSQWKYLFRELEYRIEKFDILYPDLYAEKFLIDKYFDFNSIFINRANKIIMYSEEENPLNSYFKCHLEKALHNDKLIANSKKYNLSVKECNFINCILTLNSTIELEYENGKCIRGAEAIIDDMFMETLNNIVEKETDHIKEKLEHPLIFIENLETFGYILSPNLVQIISFYDKYEIYELATFVINKLKNVTHFYRYDYNKIKFDKKNKDDNNNKYDSDDSDSMIHIFSDDSDDSDDSEMEKMEKYINDIIDEKEDTFYFHYCKWLYYLEMYAISKGENLDNLKILSSNYKKKETFKKIKKDWKYNSFQLEIVCNSNEDEFYEIIRELFVSPTIYSSLEIKYIESFINLEDNYLNYISKDIPNKNNLAYIVNTIFKKVRRTPNNFNFFNSEIMNRIILWYNNVNEVLQLIICMSNNNCVVNFNSVQMINRFDEYTIKFLFKILDHCDSATRYEDFMKYQSIWSRFCGTIDHQKLKIEHKEIIEDLLSVSKDYYFGGILLKSRNKIFYDKKEGMDLDTFYKNNLEKSIQNDKYFSSYRQLKIKVKQCHLLYCALTLNDNIEMEFENGKLFTEPPSELTDITIEIENEKENIDSKSSDDEDDNRNNDISDNADLNNNDDNQNQEIIKDNENNSNISLKKETLMDHLKEIVEVETKNIRKKLNLVLSLNENIYTIGYIMEIDLIEILAFYTPYELEEISCFFVNQLGGNKNLSNLPFPKFPNMYLDIRKSFYNSYCKWLYRLERIFHYDETVIPLSFKKFLFKTDKKKIKKREEEEEEEDIEDVMDVEDENEDKDDDTIKKNEKGKKDEHEKESKKERRERIKYEMNIDSNDRGLKIIMLGKKEEFYQTISRIIAAPESVNENDILNLKTFIQYEKDHLKYIPETIPNKENLVNIVNILLKYYFNSDIFPEDVIISLFRNVNDVLRLALVISNHSASDLGKPQRFKSFSNRERRLFMKLLNNCGGDRYDDFIKYHNIWARFFERIHPLKFKSIYPDLIEDLLGTYRFLGEPKNKQLRMEYTFYEILLKLNERLTKYREDSLKLIQYKKLVSRTHYYLSRYNIILNIENINQFFNLEFLDNDDPNDNKNPNVDYSRIDKDDVEIIRTIVKNTRINSILNEREIPLTNTEHEKLFEKFRKLEMLPEVMKNYLYSYLQSLVTVFSGSLGDLNRIFQGNWDSDYRGYVSEKYYNEYIIALKKSSIPLYNTSIPTLDLDLIQKRMNEIFPYINQLNERALNYRHERQPFNSKWVELINKKKFEEAAQLLSHKPGIFLRQLDELITKSENESQKDLIIHLFEEVAIKSSIKVLLSLKGYFQNRMKTMKGRAFLIQSSFKNKKEKQNNRIINTRKGVVTETRNIIYYTTKVKKPLDEALCQRIVKICNDTLIRNFKTKPKLNRVYISPELQKFIIPYDLRSTKNANGNMCSKGSRINIRFKELTEEYREKIIEDIEKKLEKNKEKVKKVMEKKANLEIKYINQMVGLHQDKISKKLKFLETKLDSLKNSVKKNEEELENMKNYTPSLDYKYIRLYVVDSGKFTLELYDDDLQLKRMYPTIKIYNQVHRNKYNRRLYNTDNSKNDDDSDSDDDSDDIFCCYKSNEKFYDIDLEKIVQNGIRYITINIDRGNNIKFGWMERRALNSSEKFNPENHHQSFSFCYNEPACPLILDCKTREFIWIDKELDNNYFSNFRNILEYLIIKDRKQTIEAKHNLYQKYYKYLKNIKRNKKCYESNLNVKHSLFYYYLEPLKVSINDLIQLHIQARGGVQVEKEEDLEDGDLAFLSAPPILRKETVHYIFYHQHDTILTNYMSI